MGRPPPVRARPPGRALLPAFGRLTGAAAAVRGDRPTAAEHFHDARDSVGLGEPGVAPGGGQIVADDVQLRQGRVRFSEVRIEADRFEQQSESLIGLERHPVQLRQMVIRLGVGRFAQNPGPLFVDVGLCLPIESEIDDLFAPETHAFDATRIRRTSITLVFVGPVITRSPRG